MKTTTTSTEEEKLTIRLSKDLKNAVTEHCEKEDISVSEYVRDILSANLYGRDKNAPTTLSIDDLKAQIEKEKEDIENLKTYLGLMDNLASLKKEKMALMKETESKANNTFGKK